VKGFKKCCIYNAVDGTDSDMVWDGSNDGKCQECECEEDEGTDSEHGDCLVKVDRI